MKSNLSRLELERKAAQLDHVISHCQIMFKVWSDEAACDLSNAENHHPGLSLDYYRIAGQYHGYMAHQHFDILKELGAAQGLTCPCTMCQRPEKVAPPVHTADADECEKVGACAQTGGAA